MKKKKKKKSDGEKAETKQGEEKRNETEIK
jgi:hypothetical protein